MQPLDPDASELIEAAAAIIRTRYRRGFHHVGAALRTRSGAVFSAVHLEANVGRIAVCAEAVALGMAAAAGDTDIAMIVAVNHAGEVRSPCGMCRELISDYAADALVIVPGPLTPVVVPIAQLLPNKYHR
ncbi:MAG TPA: cytidine deaminase [bacterium]|nr:cytidine deaminase [bacterium]